MMDAVRMMAAKANDRIDKRLDCIGKSPIKDHWHAITGLCEIPNPAVSTGSSDGRGVRFLGVESSLVTTGKRKF